jgi:hypothetical protein
LHHQLEAGRRFSFREALLAFDLQDAPMRASTPARPYSTTMAMILSGIDVATIPMAAVAHELGEREVRLLYVAALSPTTSSPPIPATARHTHQMAREVATRAARPIRVNAS